MNAETLKRIDWAFWRPAALTGKIASALFSLRRPDSRTLLLRPGGMGDLICLEMAIEELGLDLRTFLFLIEKRSQDWARYRGLDFVCYDDHPIATHLWIAGRFPKVINTEQYFGLSQATALMAKARGGETFAFATNRGSGASDRKVAYEPRSSHETVEFSRILGRELPRAPVRNRKQEVRGLPLVGIGGLQSPSRALRIDQWERLISGWSEGRDFEITFAPIDRAFASELARRFEGRARLFQGDFPALCDRIARAPEALTMESGFLHIASYFGVPTTAVFTSSQEKKWGSLAEGSRMIRRSDLQCQPCAIFAQVPECPHGFVCKDVDLRKNLIDA